MYSERRGIEKKTSFAGKQQKQKEHTKVEAEQIEAMVDDLASYSNFIIPSANARPRTLMQLRIAKKEYYYVVQRFVRFIRQIYSILFGSDRQNCL